MADEEVIEPSAPAADAQPEVVTEPLPDEQAKRDKVQERINKLIYEKGQLEAENRLLKERREPAAPKAAPTLEESGYDEAEHRKMLDKYYESLIATRAEEAAAKLLERRDAEAKARARDESFNSQFSKLSAAERELANSALVTDVMAELIKESEVGPKVLLHLAQNSELAETITRLPERLQAKEIGRLEAMLNQKVPTKTVSRAPPPAEKLESTTSDIEVSPTDPDSDKLSDAEWFKAEKKRLSKQR